MYAGHLLEYGPTKTIMARPKDPYTITLITVAPIANPGKRTCLTSR